MKQFPQVDKAQCKVLYTDYDCPWGGKATIYSVPLSMLHLNVDNGRIASWVSGHESNENVKHFADMTREEWNETLIKFIQASSSKDENDRTRRSILNDGQLKVGAILSDGTVVAGNRRCSILMSLLNDTGDYEKFGYFKCAIFDVPNTEEGRKQLKRLETRTQYGEDTPVAYGPIEKLVDIYTNVIAPGHPYSPSEYQNFLGLKKAQMDNLIIRATILVDYLAYLGKPGNYEVARVEKLDGPINELANLFKRVSEQEWNRIKSVFYQMLSDGQGKKGDRTRIIRNQIKVFHNDKETFERALAVHDEDLLSRDAASLGVAAPSAPSSASQSIEDMITKSAMKIQLNAAKNRPITYVTSALDELNKLDKTGISIMSEDQKKDFFRKLDILIKRAQLFTKDKFE